MAARAHDVAALALRGSAACLNFADSPRRLRVPPPGAGHDEIRRAAVEAAELFRPNQPNAAAAAAEATVVAAPGVTGSAELGASFPYYHYPVEDGLGFEMQGYFDMEQAMLIDPPQPSAAWIEDDYGCDLMVASDDDVNCCGVQCANVCCFPANLIKCNA
ncbi:hypothetical protein EJB05_39634, partial [Eragrostis curvula]